jgi:cobalt-zinc-cadmium resistance protein CzcA
MLRYPAPYRDNVEAISGIILHSPNGAQVLLRDLAEISLIDGPAQISRESGKRRLVIGVNVEGRDLGGFVQEAQDQIAKKVNLPEGYSLQWGGQFENMERAMARLMIIIPITIAAIFFLLFMLFNSIRLAGLIILVLPFASIGGIFGLLISGEYLSVPAAVGFINLWGIAVLNGVVLISFIKQLREEGRSMQDALIEGCEHRFRPVMKTGSECWFRFLRPTWFSFIATVLTTRCASCSSRIRIIPSTIVVSTAVMVVFRRTRCRWTASSWSRRRQAS